QEVMAIGQAIGQDSAALFTQIGDIAVDNQGFVYATDRYQFRVSKFSPEGKLVAEFGKHGKEMAAFESGPGCLAVGDSFVIVSDLSKTRLLGLSTGYTPLYEQRIAGPAISMAPYGPGRYVCSVLPVNGKPAEILSLYNREGCLKQLPLTGV